MQIKRNIKNVLKSTFVYSMLIKYRQFHGMKSIRELIRSDKYSHMDVHDEIIKLSKMHDVHNFVETGTYSGNTVYGVKDYFTKIYSIELSKEIFFLVKNRFKKYQHIEILNGDSAVILKEVLSLLDGPAIFWLDAHYSSGGTSKGLKHTPVLDEIGLILNHKINNHIILIDDMKDFNGENDYPTINDLENFIANNSNSRLFSIKDGVAYVTPNI